MSASLLEQLGQQHVPQRPVELKRRVHERINARLVAMHLVEVAVRVLPYAFFHFFKSLFGAVQFSLTGRYPEPGDTHAKRNDPQS